MTLTKSYELEYSLVVRPVEPVTVARRPTFTIDKLTFGLNMLGNLIVKEPERAPKLDISIWVGLGQTP